MNISKQFAAQIRDARARFKARNDIANNTKLRLFTPLTGYIEVGRAYTAAFVKIRDTYLDFSETPRVLLYVSHPSVKHDEADLTDITRLYNQWLNA